MLRHIVIFKFQKGAEQAKIEDALQQYTELFNKIGAVQAIEGGVNISKLGFDGGFSHAVILTFKDEADRDSFMCSPDHLAVNENTMKKVVEAVMVVDYIPSSKYEHSR